MRNALYLNSGADRFMEIAYLAGVASTDWTWTAKFADLDGDGWVDLFVTNGMVRDFQNSDLKQAAAGGGIRKIAARVLETPSAAAGTKPGFSESADCRFEDVSSAWGSTISESASAPLRRPRLDGDLDLGCEQLRRTSVVYRNHSHDHHFVKIRLQGERCNQYGVDSVVRIKAGGHLQARYLTISRGFMSSDEPSFTSGSVEATEVDSLEVRWRDGTVQDVFESAGRPTVFRVEGG